MKMSVRISVNLPWSSLTATVVSGCRSLAGELSPSSGVGMADTLIVARTTWPKAPVPRISSNNRAWNGISQASAVTPVRSGLQSVKVHTWTHLLLPTKAGSSYILKNLFWYHLLFFVKRIVNHTPEKRKIKSFCLKVMRDVKYRYEYLGIQST